MSRSAAARKFTVIEKRREPFRTLRGWAIAVLLETGAISECVDHSHLCDATDPDAWRQARQIASINPFKGASPVEAVAMIEDIMASIGDSCPECK
jgi:anti-sigma factor RsiW